VGIKVRHRSSNTKLRYVTTVLYVCVLGFVHVYVYVLQERYRRNVARYTHA
jgi:hypothetical protein